LGEILCEPRRLWRHGSRAPATPAQIRFITVSDMTLWFQRSIQ